MINVLDVVVVTDEKHRLHGMYGDVAVVHDRETDHPQFMVRFTHGDGNSHIEGLFAKQLRVVGSVAKTQGEPDKAVVGDTQAWAREYLQRHGGSILKLKQDVALINGWIDAHQKLSEDDADLSDAMNQNVNTYHEEAVRLYKDLDGDRLKQEARLSEVTQDVRQCQEALSKAVGLEDYLAFKSEVRKSLSHRVGLDLFWSQIEALKGRAREIEKSDLNPNLSLRLDDLRDELTALSQEIDGKGETMTSDRHVERRLGNLEYIVNRHTTKLVDLEDNIPPEKTGGGEIAVPPILGDHERRIQALEPEDAKEQEASYQFLCDQNALLNLEVSQLRREKRELEADLLSLKLSQETDKGVGDAELLAAEGRHLALAGKNAANCEQLRHATEKLYAKEEENANLAELLGAAQNRLAREEEAWRKQQVELQDAKDKLRWTEDPKWLYETLREKAAEGGKGSLVLWDTFDRLKVLLFGGEVKPEPDLRGVVGKGIEMAIRTLCENGGNLTGSCEKVAEQIMSARPRHGGDDLPSLLEKLGPSDGA